MGRLKNGVVPLAILSFYSIVVAPTLAIKGGVLLFELRISFL
jgi:hypothetical protein